jgi:hypothetical protein
MNRDRVDPARDGDGTPTTWKCFSQPDCRTDLTHGALSSEHLHPAYPRCPGRQKDPPDYNSGRLIAQSVAIRVFNLDDPIAIAHFGLFVANKLLVPVPRCVAVRYYCSLLS